MFNFAAFSPLASDDPAVAIAASRAGALGVIDLQAETDSAAALARLERMSQLAEPGWAVAVGDEALAAAIGGGDVSGLQVVILANLPHDRLAPAIASLRAAQLAPWVVALSVADGLAAQEAGAEVVIAKGYEAGGWVGSEGTFVLLQRMLAALQIPVWAHGGIGTHTVAAAYAAGAAGAVLDSQLLLARESPLADSQRAAVAAMDGSETTVLGAELGVAFRAYYRPGVAPVERLREQEVSLAAEGAPSTEAFRATVIDAVGDGSIATGLLALGQDAAFAGRLADRFQTVAGIIAGIRASIAQARDAVARNNPLAEGSPLTETLRTRYPIVQGPMTRVSDAPEFAAEVAAAGGLPFLALALMRAPEVDALLTRSAELLGDRPWGVGLLGFVPAALRAEQLEVVHRHRPPFALIAGGRPDQALAMEERGITTFLHVPSPGLLELFYAQGARRFVFEGRECGGHVGPRSSFALWDQMLDVLERRPRSGPAAQSDVEVLFAGGIHDARSASMVAAMTAAATERGVRAGVLMGTAYLFTREAVSGGAITSTFQNAAIRSGETVLLESGPGHATRCLPSPFVDHFWAEKQRLRAEGIGSEELRGELEQLNVGRLRIASKGMDRVASAPGDTQRAPLAEVDEAEQWDRGMYMIGEIAALHDEVIGIADLHADVSAGSGELLGDLDVPSPARGSGTVPPPADVAIVGMACILPRAPDATTLWANILDKVDAITEIPPERWDWRVMYDEDRAAPDKVYSRWGGFIDPVALDPLEYGLPPASLGSIEPFQLLALMTAHEALRDAGYGTRPFDRERTSVILGAGGGGADLSVGYTVRSALPSLLSDDPLESAIFERLPEWTEDSFAGILMNVAAGRIANRLDLGGTNYTVDAACASSLAAIALATRELQTGTSDMVLAGGVDALQNPFAFLCFAKTQALSPRGRCRPFDASADGIAISEGFATVALKRLADAERDGDRIYAVIRGVGAASDGRDRSLTAPRPEGQIRALHRAYDQAGFSPSTVGLIEAHGTGTVAGDGAEITALSKVFSDAEGGRHSTAVGSVKSMIGHTKATAGVAGMIKASLALHHRVLPPTIGVTEPNPKANFPESPFYVNSEPRPWLSGGADHPRRAGVSAFGFGGTDFHIVLEEYTRGYVADAPATLERWPAELLRWRGERAQIAAAVSDLDARLASGEPIALDQLAFELAGRADAAPDGGAALALAVESVDDLRAKLGLAAEILAGDAERVHRRDGVHFALTPLAGPGHDGRVAFLFPGQGSQTVDMARELTLAFPESREGFELADRVLADTFDQPLSRYVFPPPSFTEDETRRRRRELTDTHVAQPALGATELGYLRVLAAFGIEPQLTAGHSYGELVALRAAGSLSDAELLRLSQARGRFMAEAAQGEAGAMAAVDAEPGELAPILQDGGVVVANRNAPRQTVISGPRDEVAEAVKWCRAHDLGARELTVACAFHSPHVAGARERFAEVLADAEITAPRIPVYSNTTAAVHGDSPEAIVDVLGDHLVAPVDFVGEIEAMHDAGARVFVEVGPRSVLTGLTSQILDSREHVAIAVDQPGRPGIVALVHALAALSVEGLAPDTGRLFRGRRPERAAAERHRGAQRPTPSGVRWVVDGGSARPAEQPVTAVAPPIRLDPTLEPMSPATSTTPTQEGSPVNETNGHGPPGTQVLAPPPQAPSAVPEPSHAVVPAASAPAGAPAGAVRPVNAPDAAVVMSGYQTLMQAFLETQRDVMLGYLRAPRPAGGTAAPAAPPAAIASPAAVAAPALPAPAAPVPAAAVPAPIAVTVPTPAPAPAPAPPALALTALAPAPAAAPAPVPAAAPAPVAAPAAAAAPAAESVTMSTEEIEAKLLVVVSERTGYPPEMLSLDGDLEGDLGIDSIKRVEIAGTFTADLPAAQRAAIDMEQLTMSRTLREVISVIESAIGSDSSPPGDGPPLAAAEVGERPFEVGPAETERIGRFVVTPTSAPATAPTAQLAPGVVVIVDEPTGIGAALAIALQRRGQNAVLLDEAAQIADPDDARAIAERLRDHGTLSALVHVASDSAPEGGLATLLVIAQALREDLHRAAAAGGAAVLGVTRLGGSFGIGSGPDGRSGHGAIAGFVKSLALEWPEVRARAVDLPVVPDAADAERLADELLCADPIAEVGYRDGERMQLTVDPTPLADRAVTPTIDRDSVLLLTGGARGITADIAHALAVAHQPTLVLVGRSSDAPESPDTAALHTPEQLRAAMIEARRAAGQPLTPALVESDCRRILQARELRANLARLTDAGARVDYRRCDVSDAAAFSVLIESLYAGYGRIDGVIHGAGLIEDRLIADKRPDSLQRVVSTKAGAAHTLAATLRPESLRFLVLFSSVSGRFGNRGQADYAAASEVLSRLAHELDRRWPGHVVSIDWGPWRSTGMVSPALEEEFARRGVVLIEIEQGCRMLLEEIERGHKGESEIVVGAATGLTMPAPGQSAGPALALMSAAAPLAPAPDGPGRVSARRFEVSRDRYLDDHRMDGKAVLPFAVAMELMAETATLAVGGDLGSVTGLDGIRVLKGVTVPDAGGAGVAIRAVPTPEGDAAEVTVLATDRPRPHYRATVTLAAGGPPQLPDEPAPLAGLAPFERPIADAYHELLFHGPLFQGIEAIAGMDERGATASLRASHVARCVDGAEGAVWLLDPVLLDCALQMQVMWARLEWGMTLLPAEIGAYRRLRSPAEGEAVRHELRIRPESHAPMCHCDHFFYGADGKLIATLTDVVGVGSTALNRLAAGAQV